MEPMEQPSNMSPLNKFILPGSALALIAVATIVVYTTQQSKPESATPSPTSVAETSVTASQTGQNAQSGELQDGQYQAVGSYVTPGGKRDIDVSITLENNVITQATFEGHATDPASQRFQGEFADNYTSLVVGKNINNIELTKVSGSSLTPKGFMDALENIKTQAQS